MSSATRLAGTVSRFCVPVSGREVFAVDFGVFFWARILVPFLAPEFGWFVTKSLKTRWKPTENWLPLLNPKTRDTNLEKSSVRRVAWRLAVSASWLAFESLAVHSTAGFACQSFVHRWQALLVEAVLFGDMLPLCAEPCPFTLALMIAVVCSSRALSLAPTSLTACNRQRPPQATGSADRAWTI